MESPRLEDAAKMYLTYCRSKGLLPATIKTYACALNRLQRYMREHREGVGIPSPQELRSFIQSMLDEGLSRGTIRIRMRAIRAFCNFLAREELIEASPMDGVEIPKVPTRYPEIISLEQARRFLRAARGSTWTGIRNRAILGTFLDTGVRLSELIGLNLEDVDVLTGTARIRSGKGDKERHVYMGRALLRNMRKWIEVRGFHEEGTPFFLTKDGNRLDLRNVERIVSRIADRAKLGSVRITPHILRHTFATHYIQNGGDPFSLQRILGHSDIKTTMIYVNLAGAGLQEAHAKASPMDRLLSR